MEPYIQDWLDILGQMVNTNTYKLAFGLGVLECASNQEHEEDVFGTALSINPYILKDRGVLLISMKEGDSEYVDEKGGPMKFIMHIRKNGFLFGRGTSEL